MSAQHRHLAAILFTDIVGYTAMMQQDEVRAVQLVNRYLAVLKSTVASHAGKIINDYGDGSLCTFPSALEALNCAIELQAQLREEPIVPLRLGLHIGEIFFENKKVFGDGVNVASRIQSLCQANTILFSGEMLNKIKNHPEFKTISLGKFEFKNVEEPIEVFALANEGLVVPKRNEMSGKLKEQKKPTLKKNMIIGAFSMLLLFFIFIGYQQFSNKSSVEKTGNSIAVMAFTDMSSNHDQEFMSDGIAEEILNRLCKFNDLKVTGRTSSFSFKGQREDLKTIGKKLNVGNILEGSVRKEGNQIRITVKLINAATGLIIFSETYNKEFKNILSLQAKIAIDIGEKIKSTLSPGERNILTRKEVNPEAYETYLKGRAQFVNGPLNAPPDIFKAKKYFETAITLDTTFSEAFAFLALTYYNLGDWAYPQEKRKSAIDSAQLLAAKSLILDTNNSAAHLAMGSVFFHRYNWIEAEKEKRKAVELKPGGAEEKTMLASFLSQFGQYDEAIKLAEEATRLDTLDPNYYVKYAVVLIRSRKYDEAIRQCNHALRTNPNSTGAYSMLGWGFWGKKQYNESLLTWAKLHELEGRNQLAEIFRKSDFKSAMNAVIKYNNVQLKKFANNTGIAEIYAMLGNKDSTFKYLNLGYENHESGITRLRPFEGYDFIRNDPRYIVLYEKAGFKAYDDYMAGIKK